VRDHMAASVDHESPTCSRLNHTPKTAQQKTFLLANVAKIIDYGEYSVCAGA
jgi:hypothetical protein